MRCPTGCRLLACAAVAVVAGCATSGNQRENLNAVLWVQSSAEYRAAALGTYAAASSALRRLVAAEPSGARSAAVVLDIDETVLDNSRYQATSVLTGAGYDPETWDDWIALRDASAVPGAVQFIRDSQALGVDVFFITNRRCRQRPDTANACPQEQDTLANLDSVGVETDSSALMLRGERPPGKCLQLLSGSEQQDARWSSSDKTSRRDCVELDHDIVLVAGDQLGDFIGGDATTGAGEAVTGRNREKWGTRWFLIPNPTYGDWLNSVERDRTRLLQGI